MGIHMEQGSIEYILWSAHNLLRSYIKWQSISNKSIELGFVPFLIILVIRDLKEPKFEYKKNQEHHNDNIGKTN